ncbi:MFS transporter [Liquorilactobacillus oeni]|uniref:Permease n=1 Tax=Liquorilactobacillus oeni DSM 19972 TaxID=1423777 RepID=A0A0R1M8J1_9LACO|nr:MFS transporter [Liquorilactobacillus oeni]KRL04428.1 permease [Liquorilactobacillus oeni DSM 19972]
MKALKNPVPRQIIKVMGINFFGNFGSNIFSFGSGLYILHKTGSALSFSGSQIIGPIVSLFLMPIFGYLVDRYDHRKILWWSQLLAIGALLLFGSLFTIWPKLYYTELLALLVILRIADMILSTTLSASIIQIVPASHLQKLNSLNQSATSLAIIISPLLGAVLYTLLPFAWFGMVEVFAEICAIILVGLTDFNFNPHGTASQSENLLENLVSGLKYVHSQPLLLSLLGMAAFINFFFAALNVGLPFLMINILKFSNAQYSWTETAFAVGMLLFSVFLSKTALKINPVYLSINGVLLFSIIFISFLLPGLLNWSQTASLFFFIIANLLSGSLVVLINTPMLTFMQETIPQHLQGRVFALQNTLSQLLMPVGTLVYGFLFSIQTPGIVFAVSGICLAGLMLFDLVLTHHLLKEPTT